VVHGTVKGLLGLISTLVLIIVATMAGSAYRLSQGPVSLSFLTPTIEQALGQIVGGNTVFTLDETALVWDGQDDTLTIHLRNVRATGADGHSVASLPDATVSLAGAPLLLGKVAVSRVRVIHPRLRLLRTASGSFALGFGEGVDADAAALFDRAIGGRLTGSGSNGMNADLAQQIYLRHVEIVGGDLDFDDKALDMSWHAPQVDLLLERTDAGVAGSVHGPLVVSGQAAEIKLDGLYSIKTGAVTGSLKWSGIRPAYFARILPSIALLSRLQLVTGGTADFNYATDKGLSSLGFDLTGGVGSFDLTPMLANPLRVNAVALKGKLTDGMDTLAVDELRVDLGGPKLTASGKIGGINGAPRVDIAMRVDDMPVDTAKALWPAGMAANARAWIASNLSGGTIRQGDFKFAFATLPGGTAARPGAGLDLQSMSGTLRGDGISVHYFGALPSARNVAAEASLDKDSLTVTIKGGTAAGIDVRSGTVALRGFMDPEQSATIQLDLASSVRDALRLIDTKPLAYASSIGFDPERAKGDATVTLEVAMPLIKTLRMSQVKLHAHAHTLGLAVPKAAFGLDLSDGALDLDVDPRGMDVEGKASLSKIPIELKWHENFAPAPFRSRYQVKASLDDAGRKAVGLDDPALQAPVLSGTLPIDVVATFYDGGRGDVDINADLSPLNLHLPGLNWGKAPGVPGAAKAKLRVNGGGIAAVENFEVISTGMEMRGDIAFDPGNRPRRISLTTAKWGHSDFRSTITFKPENEIHLDVSGVSFDASELLSGGTGSHKLEEGQKLTVDVRKLGRVWLSDDGSIQNVDAAMTHAAGEWSMIKVNATVGQGRPLHFEVRPATEQARRTLRVTCDDAGAMFGAFGILKTVRGGTLTIDGTYLDTYPNKPLDGVLKLTDYRVVKAPLLARILTVASLTGAGDVLSGDGIHFKRAEAHFNLADDIVTLKDARTSGTEIGLTAKGQIDLNTDRLALAGTIVPAYAINSAFGEIPVIGTLLTGGQGGGLIGFNYSVSGLAGSPNVSVNPLSALTPGFLRGLFGIFDSSDGPTVAPPSHSGGQAPLPQEKSNE
jgi:hypothetical protein